MRDVREMGTVTIDVKVIVTDENDIVLYKSDNPRKGLFLSGECTNDETLALLREFFGEEIREARGCMLDTSKEQ